MRHEKNTSPIFPAAISKFNRRMTSNARSLNAFTRVFVKYLRMATVQYTQSQDI